MLTDKHMHAANILLQKEFGDVLDGFQSTLLAQRVDDFELFEGNGMCMCDRATASQLVSNLVWLCEFINAFYHLFMQVCRFFTQGKATGSVLLFLMATCSYSTALLQAGSHQLLRSRLPGSMAVCRRIRRSPSQGDLCSSRLVVQTVWHFSHSICIPRCKGGQS